MALIVDDDARWNAHVKRIIRSEMMRRGITYDQLAVKLEGVGVKDSSANLRNKVARGKFSAAFFVQCLAAIGCADVNIII